MLLQTNSYVVPKEKRVEHARLLRRFRQALMRLGCDHFEVYEQVGSNWNSSDTTGRFVQIMRFRDRKHQLSVQSAERSDPTAQALLREFCELINFPYQQQQGLFAAGYYTSFMRMPPQRPVGANVSETPEVTEISEAPALSDEREQAEEHEHELEHAQETSEQHEGNDSQINVESVHATEGETDAAPDHDHDHAAEHETDGSNGDANFTQLDDTDLPDLGESGAHPDAEAGNIGPAHDDDDADDAESQNRTTSSNS